MHAWREEGEVCGGSVYLNNMALCDGKLEAARLAEIADARALPHPALPPLGSSACAPWPTEQAARAESKRSTSTFRKDDLEALAARWLEPLAAGEWDLGAARRSACPTIHVVGGREIYLAMPEGDPTNFTSFVSFVGCGRPPRGSTLSGASWMYALRARLLVLLRFLRLAINTSAGSDWPEHFTLTACTDDSCHANGGAPGLALGQAGASFWEGASHQRVLPLMTMVACGGGGSVGLSWPSLRATTVPWVQWLPSGTMGSSMGVHEDANVTRGDDAGWYSQGYERDVDLAQWEVELERRGRAARRNLANWECREPRAAWRGSAIIEHGSLSANWSASGVLERRRVEAVNWQRTGRFALVWHKCSQPELYNIRVKAPIGTAGAHVASAGWSRDHGLDSSPHAHVCTVCYVCTHAYHMHTCTACIGTAGAHREWSRFQSTLGQDQGQGTSAAEEFGRCAAAIGMRGPTSSADGPKYMGMAEQARRFQMAVYVEGSDGWADRLRHLLLSGMAVLKQVCPCMCVCIWAWPSSSRCAHACVCISMCVYVCICMYVCADVHVAMWAWLSSQAARRPRVLVSEWWEPLLCITMHTYMCGYACGPCGRRRPVSVSGGSRSSFRGSTTYPSPRAFTTSLSV